MFIEKVQNNGKNYLRLVKSIRVRNKDGYKVSQKKVIYNIGPLAQFDDGKPDYLERLKKSFRAGIPLIPSLKPFCTDETPRDKYVVTFDEGNPNCAGEPKIFSHLLLERIVEELGLRNLFASYKGFTKIEYDVYSFFKLLLFGRILNPASKMATVRQNDDYYEPILSDFNPDNVYDTLDFIAENKDRIVRRINTNLVKKSGRRSEIIYYDVTNFYFETEQPDDDELDDDGEVTETGLRKLGVSKECRKQPIVQMGLFMDDAGIPITIESFPGNMLDHFTLRDCLKNNIDGIELSRFILIGDRGICMYPNLLNLLDSGHGYIVAKSIAKSKAAERKWIYSQDGYIHEKNGFKYKSRVVSKKVKDENGVERAVSELVVAYWSEKYAKRQMAENKSFLEFIAKLLEHPANFRITATQSKSIRKYLDKKMLNKNTGEIVNSSELLAMVDIDKLNSFKESMGYYQIVTSELLMDPKEVIDKYHGLSRIEEQFRIMKGALSSRPLHVWTKEHIKAHLLICAIAVIVMRIIQNRIAGSGLVPSAKDKEVSWTAGLSAERIQRALGKWQVDRMPDDYYRFLSIDDPDLKLVLDAFDIQIPYKLFRRGELKGIKTGTRIFI
jgi:transposase